LIHFSPLPALL